jgi:hypothetical protein
LASSFAAEVWVTDARAADTHAVGAHAAAAADTHAVGAHA